MEEHQQFNINCTTFTGEQLKAINLTRSIVAIVCVIIVVLILLFLLCHKTYSSTFQRLYIYVIVATILSESVQACGIEHQFHYRGQKVVCFWLAFITHWTSIMVFIFAFETILYLFYLVITQIRGSCCCHPTQSKCYQAMLEMLFIMLPILLSFPIAYVPYMNNNYGLAGPWCWVRSIDEKCKSVGMRDQMIYFGLYWAVGAIGIIINIIFSVVYLKLTGTYKEARKLLKLTLILMGFQLGYITIVTLQLAVRLYTAISGSQQHIALWFMHAFIIPNGQLIFPIGYFICFNPVKNMLYESARTFRVKCKEWYDTCICRARNGQDLVERDIEQTTVPNSTRISQPSNTFFVIPYTDDFTKISADSENSNVLHHRNYGTFQS